jgi:hypothetical protein
MPRSLENNRIYMRRYYKKHREECQARTRRNKALAEARDPEKAREKWRLYKARYRAKAALRELEAIRAQRPPKAAPGYEGRLNVSRL